MRRRSFSFACFQGTCGIRAAKALCLGASLLVILLVAVVSFPVADPITSFPDVPASHPYYTAITDLASRGIIGGYGTGNFGPSDNVTRLSEARRLGETPTGSSPSAAVLFRR